MSEGAKEMSGETEQPSGAKRSPQAAVGPSPAWWGARLTMAFYAVAIVRHSYSGGFDGLDIAAYTICGLIYIPLGLWAKGWSRSGSVVLLVYHVLVTHLDLFGGSLIVNILLLPVTGRMVQGLLGAFNISRKVTAGPNVRVPRSEPPSLPNWVAPKPRPTDLVSQLRLDVAEYIGVASEALEEETRFKKDLRVPDGVFLDLLGMVEDEFGVDLDFESIETYGDLLRSVDPDRPEIP